jgi:hypothetical protein
MQSFRETLRGSETSSPSAEDRSDIAEADQVTDSQALVFPAHNAHEDRAR